MKNLARFSLLYAEDDAETRKYYAKYFNHIFDEIYIAHNGEQAKQLYQLHQPKVLILDNYMPKLTGLDLAKEIRETDNTTKIVLLTAADDQATLLKAIELNLVTYLIKPVRSQQLKTTLLKLSKELVQANQLYSWIYQGITYQWDGIQYALTYVSDKVNSDNDDRNEDDSGSIALTKKEQRLFHLLISEQSRKASLTKIFQTVYFDEPHKDFSEYAIKALIKSLRNKLPDGAIKNSYGQGFYLHQ